MKLTNKHSWATARVLAMAWMMTLAATGTPLFAEEATSPAPESAAPSADAPAAAPGPAATQVVVDEKSQEVIRRIAAWYDQTKASSVRLTSVQRIEIQGQLQERSTFIDVVVERPNKLSLNIEAAKGGIINSDGKTMSVYVPPTNRWVALEAPENFTALMGTEVVRGMVPLAQSVLNFFAGNVVETLKLNTKAISHAGVETFEGVEVDHLVFKQEPVDVHMYVRTGDKPEVLRIAPDGDQYLEAIRAESPDAPVTKIEIQFNYTNWAFSDDIDDKAFAFVPPPGVPKAESMLAALGVEQSDPRMLKDKDAPAFDLPLLDGGKMSLAAHKGKQVVVLDFWATWCGPCVRAMPALDELAQELADQNVIVYALNQREPVGTINPFLEQHGFKALRIALDSQGEVATQYMVRGIPQTVVIDKQGVVRAVHVGFSPTLKEELLADIKPLLSE